MEQEQNDTKKSSKDLLTQISTDFFLIKEKFTDQEFKQLMNHMKLLFEKLERDRKLVVELLNKTERLKMQYMRLAETNDVMYRTFNESDYHDGCSEHYIHHQ